MLRSANANASIASSSRWRAAVEAGRAPTVSRLRLAHQGERVLDAGDRRGAGHGAVAGLPAGARDDEQMAGEIAAVDRRDVARIERAQIGGGVPVVEMAAVALQPLHRGEGRLEPLHRFGRADPAEIAGGDDREQIQAHVGRRGAPRERRLRILLEIVRRQRMVRGRHEGLEKAPGPACDQPQGALVRLGCRDATRDLRRAADAPRDQRRRDPGRDEGEGEPQPGRALRRGDGDHGAEADRDGAGHARVVARDPGMSARLGLCRGEPFEHPPAPRRETPACAHDRVGHRPGLVREEGQEQRGLQRRDAQRVAECAEMTAQRDSGATRDQVGHHRQQRRKRDRRDDERGPDRRGRVRQHPSRDQREDRARRRQRAAQVVGHLPDPDQRDRGHPRRAVGGTAAEDPGQELPVAARPAMLARDRDVVAGGEFLDDLDVRDEARAREDAFEQVVAEQRVLGHAAGERRLEGIDVVDALAGIGPLVEQVLVDVGDRARIGIDPAMAREYALEQRALDAHRQRGRDARLEHAVAFDDASRCRIEARSVERMGELAHQAARRVARQARIGIERDHEAYAGRHAFGRDERGVVGAAQQPVELVQLAALALPAHP
jgi:hypothetical protein